MVKLFIPVLFSLLLSLIIYVSPVLAEGNHQTITATVPLSITYLPIVVCGSFGCVPTYSQPAGYRLYFSDEFDSLQPYWNQQGQMTAASYAPPKTGYVRVKDGTLKVGVPGVDTSFPYLYIIDDQATTYDVPYTTQAGSPAPRVDWLPNTGDFQIAMRVRFNAQAWGEHRISIYADGHQPTYGGRLFYIGSDYNGQQEAWRGLIVGADRGNAFADLGDLDYTDPYTGWVIITVDFRYSSNLFMMTVDNRPVIIKQLASFKDYPTRPDILFIGSLALLESPSPWTDIEVDWLRVYAPENTSPAKLGLLNATIEESPVPTDTVTAFSTVLPAGPFANMPHWSEHFTETQMPSYWQQVLNPSSVHAWTNVANSLVSLNNDGNANRVPVWAIFDDMLPLNILSTANTTLSPQDYLRQRGGSPLVPDGDINATAIYTRSDWRPNNGNVRYAWRSKQTANGYGVEVSNGGHFPYFTGAMFYTLQDTTSNNGHGQFIFPGCQEQYFWRLERLPGYAVPDDHQHIVGGFALNFNC